MNKDLKTLRAGMAAQKTPEPVAGLLAFAFGLVLVGIIVGLIWAVFETPAPRGAPVIADHELVLEVAVEPEPEPISELAGGLVVEVAENRSNLPTPQARDAHLRKYVDTIDRLDDCARTVGQLNLRTLRDTYVSANRAAYEAWMNTPVSDLPLIRRTRQEVSDETVEPDNEAAALQLQLRAEAIAVRDTGPLTANDCAQLKIDVQTGLHDVALPPSA